MRLDVAYLRVVLIYWEQRRGIENWSLLRLLEVDEELRDGEHPKDE